MWLSIKANNNLHFRLHHIWPSSSAQHNSVQFGEGTAVAKDLLHLSSKLRQGSWAPSLFIVSWIQEKMSAEQKRGPGLSSASPGGWITISRVNMNPGKQSERQSISLGVCILLNNVWPPGRKGGQKRGYFHLHAHPYTHSLALQQEVLKVNQPWEKKLHWMTKWIFILKQQKTLCPCNVTHHHILLASVINYMQFLRVEVFSLSTLILQCCFIHG